MADVRHRSAGHDRGDRRLAALRPRGLATRGPGHRSRARYLRSRGARRRDVGPPPWARPDDVAAPARCPRPGPRGPRPRHSPDSSAASTGRCRSSISRRCRHEPVRRRGHDRPFADAVWSYAAISRTIPTGWRPRMPASLPVTGRRSAHAGASECGFGPLSMQHRIRGRRGGSRPTDRRGGPSTVGSGATRSGSTSSPVEGGASRATLPRRGRAAWSRGGLLATADRPRRAERHPPGTGATEGERGVPTGLTSE